MLIQHQILLCNLQANVCWLEGRIANRMDNNSIQGELIIFLFTSCWVSQDGEQLHPGGVK